MAEQVFSVRIKNGTAEERDELQTRLAAIQGAAVQRGTPVLSAPDMETIQVVTTVIDTAVNVGTLIITITTLWLQERRAARKNDFDDDSQADVQVLIVQPDGEVLEITEESNTSTSDQNRLSKEQ